VKSLKNIESKDRQTTSALCNLEMHIATYTQSYKALVEHELKHNEELVGLSFDPDSAPLAILD